MKTLKRLMPYLKGSGPIVALSLLFAALSVAMKIAVPFLCGKAIDSIRSGNTDIAIYLFAIGGCLLGGALFRYLFDLVNSYLGQNVVKQMRDKVFHQLQNVPLSYIDRHPHGDLMLRLINDLENVQTGLIAGFGAIYEGIVQILVTFVFMMIVHWALALVVVCLTPISVVVSRFISKSNSKYFKQQNARLGDLTAYSLETLTNLDTIQGFGLFDEREKTFESKNKEVRESNFKAMFAACWVNPATRLVNGLIYGTVISLGVVALLFPESFSWTGVAFSVGGLSSFLTYSYQFMTPFNEVADASAELFYAAASLERVDELIHAEPDVDEGKESIDGRIGQIEARDMTFSYDGKRTIIDSFNAQIGQGKKIALVGPTGCGKTTIINLLMRFYDPQKGGFVYDEINALDIEKKNLRSHFGMVLQDTYLFHGTVKDNIAYGRPDAPLEEIKAVAKLCGAHHFIRQMKQGYDTVLSSNDGLSTGERQLLCVARILLAEPEIVLLDEATSNIDLRTELALASAFDELMKGKTSIVVAHRLSTIRNADTIIVLKDGKIIEQGNFASLLEKGGFFAELYEAQFG